jgi:hypothetical protein
MLHIKLDRYLFLVRVIIDKTSLSRIWKWQRVHPLLEFLGTRIDKKLPLLY